MIGPHTTTPEKRLRLHLEIRFETAWRIGSGREGETTDLGVLKDAMGRPVLPGSSLKGKLRSSCERLAHALSMSACLLDKGISGVDCVSDVSNRELYKVLDGQRQSGTAELLAWLAQHTCDICRLFGSPEMGGRLVITDGVLDEGTWPGVIERRDGVVIDRDSRTARDGLKYDFDVAPAGMVYRTRLDLANPEGVELALLGAALLEWEEGVALGGSASRGLGQAKVRCDKVEEVDLANADQRRAYLLKREWTPVGDFTSRVEKQIDERLASLP